MCVRARACVFFVCICVCVCVLQLCNGISILSKTLHHSRLHHPHGSHQPSAPLHTGSLATACGVRVRVRVRGGCSKLLRILQEGEVRHRNEAASLLGRFSQLPFAPSAASSLLQVRARGSPRPTELGGGARATPGGRVQQCSQSRAGVQRPLPVDSCHFFPLNFALGLGSSVTVLRS